MKYDVFISYSRKDTAIADKICLALEHQRITYFIDRKGIGGGMEFPKVLAEAIMNSSIMLFLGSKNSYESKFTNNEVTFAFNKMTKGTIIPYIIDSSTLPPALEFTFSSINIRTIQEHPIETTLMQDLCHILKRDYISTNKLNNQHESSSVMNVNPILPKSTEKSIVTPNKKTSSNITNGDKKNTDNPSLKKLSPSRTEGKRRTEKTALYRKLGMFDKANVTERDNREDGSWWWELFNFFFDFSRESVLNYIITLIALIVLISLMYYNGYFNNHPFLISEMFITTFISYIGMRCILNLGIATDDSEEITSFLKGVVIIPFIVLLSPLLFSMIIAGILWWLSYHIFGFVLFHSAGLVYLYFSTACFTLITLIYSLYKRKNKHSR